MLDYCSAYTKGLFQCDFENLYYQNKPMWLWKTYDYGADFHRLLGLLCYVNQLGVSGLSVGPYSFEKGSKFWETHRVRTQLWAHMLHNTRALITKNRPSYLPRRLRRKENFRARYPLFVTDPVEHSAEPTKLLSTLQAIPFPTAPSPRS